jgi:hypothetical protein
MYYSTSVMQDPMVQSFKGEKKFIFLFALEMAILEYLL